MTVTTAPDLERRIEVLSEQVRFLVEDAEERRRMRDTATDLIHDLGPIASQGMDSITQIMTDAEKRGYIDFARSGLGVVNRVVTSFTEEDVEALGDNIVLILETVKEMTQPEIMTMLRSTFHEVGEVEESEIPPSAFALLRQMREPEVRRGLARLITVLRTMGSAQMNGSEQGKEARQ